MLVVAWHDAVEHRIGIAVDHGERRPHLVPELLREIDPLAERLVERIHDLTECGRGLLAGDLLTEQVRDHLEQRLLVRIEHARLAMVKAERPVQAAVGQADVARAERAHVPRDTDPLLQPEPRRPQRRNVLGVRDGGRRLARVHARAEAQLPRNRPTRLQVDQRAVLEPTEDVASVPRHLGDDGEVDAAQPLDDRAHPLDRLGARHERLGPKLRQRREPDRPPHVREGYALWRPGARRVGSRHGRRPAARPARRPGGRP